MKPSNFEICTGVFICQICRHYRNQEDPESKKACHGCKHLADIFLVHPEESTEEIIERNR